MALVIDTNGGVFGGRVLAESGRWLEGDKRIGRLELSKSHSRAYSTVSNNKTVPCIFDANVLSSC